VVGNGDVITVEDYLRMREETGCDAVMIGRGALGNPWLFGAIAARLRGQEAPRVTPAERLRVFLRHIDLMTAHTPQKRLVHELRKAVAWYTKGLRDSASVRERCFDIKDPSQVREIASGYFELLCAETERVPREAAESMLQQENLRAAPRVAVDKDAREVA
jgi:tRNA-dihydrouridine synthase